MSSSSKLFKFSDIISIFMSGIPFSLSLIIGVIKRNLEFSGKLIRDYRISKKLGTLEFKQTYSF